MRSLLSKPHDQILLCRQFNIDDSLQSRRGVLLLIVVSMLTLFLMLGTAYIVAASRARESARALSRKTLFADQLNYRPETYLDEVLMRLVRGGPSVALPTAIGSGVAPSFESLLEDRYGNSTQLVTGTVSSPQIYSDTGSGNTGPVLSVVFSVSTGTVTHPAELNGRILTLTADGKPAMSHRIVRAYAAGSGYSLALTNPRSPHQWTSTTISDFSGNAVINGREFSGAAGAPNEAWDGFDSDNPYLAQVEPGVTVSKTTVARPTFFDRSDWSDAAADIDGDRQPDNDPAQDIDGIDCDTDGILDSADNDGDGVSDGVFLEWGFEPLPTAAGDVRLHASALIVDLDGRFNVNAHGSLASMPLRDGTPTNPADSIYSSLNPDWPKNAGVDRSAIVTEFQSVPLGAGVGPADVNPNHLFSTLALNAATPSSSTTAGLDEQVGGFVTTGGRSGDALGTRPSAGRFTAGVNTPRVGAVEGRYGGSGADLDTLAANPPTSIASASKNGVSSPGRNIAKREVSDNILAALGVPDNWWGGTTNSYSSPPDLLGRMKVLTRGPLDETGSSSDEDGDGRVTRGLVPRPTYAKAEWTGEQAYSPYSTRLTSIGTRGGSLHSPSTDGTTSASVVTENPFTLGELESVLRPYDTDNSNLPVRLTAMLGTVAEQMRTRLTTESWDTTCVVDGTAGGAWDRLATSLATLPTGAGLYNVSPVLGAIGGEISRGEKFNLNRPLTNTKPVSYLATDLYYLQRQAYFKDLYTLICLLADPADQDKLDSTHGSYDPAFQREVAQWAANVVEFRDADSTMTPFEYDTNVFNGWDVDGDVTTFAGETERGEIVWGLERPEVVLTSAVGWEDASDGEIYVCIHRPWKAQALFATGLQVANKLDADLAVGGAGDDLDLTATVNDGSHDWPVWRFRLEDADTGSSAFIPIVLDSAKSTLAPTIGASPPLFATDWTSLGKTSWPASASDLQVGGDGSLLIRMAQTTRNALLISNQAGMSGNSSTMPAVQPFLLRDTGSGQPDREFELFGVPFPTGSLAPSARAGVDRELILHIERLSCPRHAFVETTGAMVFGDPGDRIDNSGGGATDTGYLLSPRYLSIDSIRLVVRNRRLNGAIVVPPSHADIQNVENTRSISGVVSTDFWQMDSSTTLGTGRSTAADAPGAGGNTDLTFISPGGGTPASLPWPNRPFVSSAELLLVPDDPPTEFLRNYGTKLVGGVTDLPANNPLLDAVTVPSWYAGIHDSWVDGSNLLRGQTGIDERINPVNQLSSYREPGRVNLNTVVNDQVWDAVVAGPLPIEDVDRDGSLEWDYNTPPNGLDPHPVMERASTIGGPTGADLDASPAVSMAEVLQIGGSVGDPIRFDATSTYYGAVNVDLNPLHKIYTASRLANTATVRSNVFAIWVTLRESISGDPDSVKYHRAFYIVDRSIPVGFEPGKDHNVRDVIRLRRIIE